MRIHYLQHVPFEGLGSIKSWIVSQGHMLTATRFYKDDTLPKVEEVDWLIIMGGPMSAYDEDSGSLVIHVVAVSTSLHFCGSGILPRSSWLEATPTV